MGDSLSRFALTWGDFWIDDYQLASFVRAVRSRVGRARDQWTGGTISATGTAIAGCPSRVSTSPGTQRSIRR